MPVPLSAYKIKILSTDLVVAEFIYLTFEPTYGSGGEVKSLTLICLSTAPGSHGP